MTNGKTGERLRWALEVQVLPEGYIPAEATAPAEFAVCWGENLTAAPAMRFAVSVARSRVLDGVGTPMPGEPFTEFYGRRAIATRRYEELRADLLGR